MLLRTGKWLAVIAGWVCLGTGIIGIFIPLLPTTPFILLSAYCFSVGSKPLHDWLLSRPKAGPLIRDWETHRVIRPRAKAMAITMLCLCFGYALLFVEVGLWIKLIISSIGLSIIAFILRQRSQRVDLTLSQTSNDSKNTEALKGKN